MNDVAETTCFDCFTLDRRRRVLLVGGKPVSLHARALSLLIFLIDNRERPVSRADIITHVWDGRAVAENNLAVQLSSLRKALTDSGATDNPILTLPNQHYQFIGKILPAQDEPTPSPLASPDPPARAVPAAQAAMKRFPRARHGALGAGAALLLAAGALLLHRPAAHVAPPLSIAVMPFRNEGPDRTQDYLAAAITDDLNDDLGHIPGSTVIARASTETVQHQPLPQIGAQLDVRYVLTGTLTPEDTGYHVVAALSDAATARQLWSATFDPERGHLAELRQDIVRHIASPLHVALDQLADTSARHDRPNNPDALDLFFRARAILDTASTLSAFQSAEDLLRAAIEKQPDFTDAQALLAWMLLRKVSMTADPDQAPDTQQAASLIGQVLAISPQNTTALSARVALHALNHECAGARADGNFVLQLEPSNLPARRMLGLCDLAEMHWDAAALAYQRLLQLDPANPQNRIFHFDIGSIRLMQGRYAEAVDALAQGIDPNAQPASDLEFAEQAQLLLIAATYLAGDRAAARADYDTYTRRYKGRTVWRIGQYFPTAWQQTPALNRALQALKDAGMPAYADENEPGPDDDKACQSGNFEPTPRHLPNGGRVLTTAEFEAAVHAQNRPLVIDIGQSPRRDMGWTIYDDTIETDAPEKFALRIARDSKASIPDQPIIIVGTGVRGCSAYDIAKMLIDDRISNVELYRGGEEAWDQHHGVQIQHENTAVTAKQPT